MKVIEYEQANKPLAIGERPIPTANAGELIMRVEACGICGSDIHAATTGFLKPGTVIGHEFSGEIVEVGRDCAGWQSGDRAVGMAVWCCGKCPNCLANEPELCTDGKYLGFDESIDGAYAQYVRIQAATTRKIPDSMSFETAALWEPLAVAQRAINRANLTIDDSVLIIGAGTIGLSIALIAKSLRIRNVGLSETQPQRIARAKDTGAFTVINGANVDNPVEEFVSHTGREPTVIFECVGKPGMFQRLVDWAPMRSHLVMVGACTVPEELTVVTATFKELTCSFSVAYSGKEVDTVLTALAERKLDPLTLVTRRITLNDLPAVFEQLKQPNSECKVLWVRE